MNSSGLRPLAETFRVRPMVAITLLVVATALALRSYSFTSAGLDWDESLYIVIAQRWLAGGVPYLAVWDQHPMGLPALFAVVDLAIGDGLVAARVACFAFVAGTAVLLGLFMVRHAGSLLGGLIAGLLYLLYMSRPEGLAANTECFNNLMVTAASFLLYNEATRPGATARRGPICAASLLLGVGIQIKYVVLPEAVLLCGTTLLILWRSGAGLGRVIRLATLSLAGGLLPTVLMTLYFWHVGAMAAYLDGNISANLNYVDKPLAMTLALLRLRYGLLPLIGLLPWPLVLAWLWRSPQARRGYELLALWLAVWLVAVCLDIAMPMKLWKHYFNALVPPLCLTAALSMDLMLRRARISGGIVALLLVIAAMPAVVSVTKHFSDSRSIDRMNVPRVIADRIRAGGTDRHDVYVFNYDPLVYAYTNAIPPTRYVLGIELAEFSHFSRMDSRMEIDRVLATWPRWIVVAEPSPYKYTPAVWDDLRRTLQHYRIDAEYPEADYIQPPIRVRLYHRMDIPDVDRRLPQADTRLP